MSGGKRRSGFQITSVTSDPHPAAGQSAGSSLLAVVQSEGSSSQPTTPCLKRKQLSHDAPGLQSVVAVAAGSSRFRVVRLAAPAGGGLRGNEPYRRGRWTCSDFLERREGAGLRRLMDTRHAHSLESLELIGRDGEGAGLEGAGLKGAGLVLRSGPPSPSHSRQEPISIRLLDRNVPPPSPRIRNIPPPLRLDVDAAGRSVLRQSLSQPGSPSSGPFHPLTPAAFSLDQTIFTLQGDDSSPGNSLVAIDNKIEQAMDLVKSHLMLAVREEVELLREQIRELQDKNTQLERENHILRALTHNKHTT